MKDIEPAVAHAIQIYQKTSRLKLYRRLFPENCKAIAQAVVENGDAEHLVSLMKKRDHYTAKIHELLNNSGAPDDPGLINSRSDAEHYIIRRVLKDEHKVASIRALIEKHLRFQEQWGYELRRIDQGSQNKRSALKGLAKLGAMADMLAAKDLARQETMFNELYEKVAKTQQELCDESLRTLRDLGIPFFAAIGDVSEDDKVFVLEYLQNHMSN